MAKYAANSMLAPRISFMNELSMLCEKVGADVEQVRAGMGSDSRIGNAFLFAGVGYGGSCFPKDVRALIYMGNQAGVPMSIAQSVQQVNQSQQSQFADKIIHYFKDQPNVQLGVWGLAFKARTDYIRESPALFCIEKFLAAGIKVVAFDPEAMAPTRQKLGDKIRLVDNGYDVLDGSAALVIFTDWQEFRTPDLEQIAKRLQKPVVFDGRNLYTPTFVKRFGIEYHCIGRTQV